MTNQIELYLFHHDPDQDHASLDKKLVEFKAALDKLESNTIVLAPTDTQILTI